jgi:hypothetical protein
MATLAEIRQSYPQYADIPDNELADALHKKFYSDIPKEDFDRRVGLTRAEPELDKYKETVRRESEDRRIKGIDTSAGLSRLGLHGATLGASDEILAGALTPFEMVKRGTFNPAEGYRYAKAQQNLDLEEGRKRAGVVGTGAEIAGGVMSGTGLARAGLTTARLLGQAPGAAGRFGSAVADAAGFGAVAGGLEGEGTDRFKEAAKGAALGGAVAGVGIPVLGAAKMVAAPIISNIRARINPEGVATSQVARALTESGRTPQQIVQETFDAANQGQGAYTVADALGHPGQRLLSTAARSPGEGRTQIVDFLQGRQADQGRRVAQQVAEGFDSPQTAQQTRTAMTAARDDAADVAYGAARQNARPVDLSNVIARIDDTLQPGVNQIARPQSGIANDSIESALDGIRRRLTDGRSVLSDFTAIQRVRGDVSDAVQAAQRAGQGNRARMLGGILREIDTAMESASTGFRQANRNFAQATRDVEQVDAGRNAYQRGRTEDIIPQFQAQTPQGQQAFRTGYSDPIIENALGAQGATTNRARFATSPAFRDEAAAMAPRSQRMLGQLDRENRMHETMNQATQGSRTFDNFADDAAARVDPSIVASLLSGNFTGAARQGLATASNVLHGNTPEVRQRMAELLLSRGQGAAPTMREVDAAIRRLRATQAQLLAAGRGAYGGVAVAPSAMEMR